MRIRVIQPGQGFPIWGSAAGLCVHLGARDYRRFIFPSREMVGVLMFLNHEFVPLRSP